MVHRPNPFLDDYPKTQDGPYAWLYQRARRMVLDVHPLLLTVNAERGNESRVPSK